MNRRGFLGMLCAPFLVPLAKRALPTRADETGGEPLGVPWECNECGRKDQKVERFVYRVAIRITSGGLNATTRTEFLQPPTYDAQIRCIDWRDCMRVQGRKWVEWGQK